MTRLATRRTLGLLAGATLLVAACGSDDESGEPAGGASLATTTTTTTTVLIGGGSSDAATTTTSTTIVTGGAQGGSEPAETTTTIAPTTTPDTTTTEPPQEGCGPVGEWRLREQAYLEELSVLAGAGSGVSFEHGGGEYRVTLNDDGTYVGRRDMWQIRLAAPEGTIVTTIDSTDAGTYTLDGNRISMTDPGSPATVRVQIELGGVLQDLPGGVGGAEQQVGTSGISGSGTWTCENGVLSITVDELPDLPAGQTLTAVFDPI